MNNDNVEEPVFDLIKTTQNHDESWSARELMPLLGYDRWDNFSAVIARAEIACEQSNYAIKDHFRKATKMIEIGKDAIRVVEDYSLTRYACYLIARNGSSQKPEIATAQTYFAIQTRRQEIGQQQREQFERITTPFNTRRNDLRGVETVAREHEQNNSKVRAVLRDRGITPETLKPEEDIKKLERRMKKRQILPKPSPKSKLGE